MERNSFLFISLVTAAAYHIPMDRFPPQTFNKPFQWKTVMSRLSLSLPFPRESSMGTRFHFTSGFERTLGSRLTAMYLSHTHSPLSFWSEPKTRTLTISSVCAVAVKVHLCNRFRISEFAETSRKSVIRRVTSLEMARVRVLGADQKKSAHWGQNCYVPLCIGRERTLGTGDVAGNVKNFTN